MNKLFLMVVLSVTFALPGMSQYSGVDGCSGAPCANATPCRHCSGNWSDGSGGTFNLTSSLVSNAVSGSASFPIPGGCPNFTFQVNSTTSSITPAGGSYPFVPGTTGMVLHLAPSPGFQVCGPYVATNVTVNVQVRNDGCDIAFGSASNDDGSASNPAYPMAKIADLPTSEVTTAVGWSSGLYATVQQFRQTLQGSSTRPFDGRQVTEAAGSDNSDGCYYSGAAARGFTPFGVTGGWWIVGRYATPPLYVYTNTWIDDYVGFLTDLVTFYRDNGRAPCSATAQQLMKMCTNGQGCANTQQFSSNYLTYSLTSTTVTAGRASVNASKTWP